MNDFGTVRIKNLLLEEITFSGITGIVNMEEAYFEDGGDSEIISIFLSFSVVEVTCSDEEIKEPTASRIIRMLQRHLMCMRSWRVPLMSQAYLKMKKCT